MTDDDFAVLTTAETEFEAEAKAEALRARGVEARVMRNAPSWTGHASISPTARGASIFVLRDDLERARTILKQVVADSVDIEWDEVDVGEREDDLPLHEVGRMPPLAKVSFVVALAIVLLAFGWLIGMLFVWFP